MYILIISQIDRKYDSNLYTHDEAAIYYRSLDDR